MRRVTAALALLLVASGLLLTGCGADPAFTSGKVYLADQNYQRAIEQLHIAIRNNPSAWEPRVYLGRTYGDLAEASTGESVTFPITKDGKAEKIEVQPGQTDILLPLVHDEFQKALELAPDEKAKEQVENAITQYWLIFHKRGEQYVEAARFEEAAPEFEKAIVIDDRRPDAYINLGYALHMSGNEDRAIEVFESALERAPGNATLKENLVSVYQAKGGALASAGDYPNALRYFEKIQRVAPETADINYNIGLMYYQTKEYREALKYFRVQLDTFGDDEEVLYRVFLAHWAIATNFDNEASVAIDEESKAVVLQSAQDAYMAALDPLLKLKAMNSEEVTYHRALARVYNKLGRNDEAMQELKEVEALLKGSD
ncbi:MAG: tetratricopeptide repeat protein [Candidatus Eisenbacteria bacterium]|nr:tetratricopeptide repeat protein [Candidatus Eisenbacteria bacterium]